MDTQLTNKGWYLSDDGIKICSELCRKENPSINDIIKVALNNDLRKISRKKLSEAMNSGQMDHIAGPVVLQIQKLRNISAPLANQDSQGAPRMFKFNLTDGFTSCVGIEINPVSCLNAKMIPGMKLCLNGKISLLKGVLLFEDGNVTNLGGEVEILKSKWLANKHADSAKRTTANNADIPPHFKEFDPSKTNVRRTTQPPSQKEKNDFQEAKNQSKDLNYSQKQYNRNDNKSKDSSSKEANDFQKDRSDKPFNRDNSKIKSRSNNEKFEGYGQDKKYIKNDFKDNKESNQFRKDQPSNVSKGKSANETTQSVSSERYTNRKYDTSEYSSPVPFTSDSRRSTDGKRDEFKKEFNGGDKTSDWTKRNDKQDNDRYKSSIGNYTGSSDHKPKYDKYPNGKKDEYKKEINVKDKKQSSDWTKRSDKQDNDRYKSLAGKDKGSNDHKPKYDRYADSRKDEYKNGKDKSWSSDLTKRNDKQHDDRYKSSIGNYKGSNDYKPKYDRYPDSKNDEYKKEINGKDKNQSSDWTKRNDKQDDDPYKSSVGNYKGSNDHKPKYDRNADSRKDEYTKEINGRDKNQSSDWTKQNDKRDDDRYKSSGGNYEGSNNSKPRYDRYVDGRKDAYKKEINGKDKNWSSDSTKQNDKRDDDRYKSSGGNYKGSNDSKPRYDRYENDGKPKYEDGYEKRDSKRIDSKVISSIKTEDIRFKDGYDRDFEKRDYRRSSDNYSGRNDAVPKQYERNYDEEKRSFKSNGDYRVKTDRDDTRSKTGQVKASKYSNDKRRDFKEDKYRQYDDQKNQNGKFENTNKTDSSYKKTQPRVSKDFPDNKSVNAHGSKNERFSYDKKEKAQIQNDEDRKPESEDGIQKNAGKRIPLDVLFGKQVNVAESNVKKDIINDANPPPPSHQINHQDTQNMMSDPHKYLAQMSPQEIQYLQWSIAQQSYILNEYQQQQQQPHHHQHQQVQQQEPNRSMPSSAAQYMPYPNYPQHQQQQYSGDVYPAALQTPSNVQLPPQHNQPQQQTYNQTYYSYDPR